MEVCACTGQIVPHCYTLCTPIISDIYMGLQSTHINAIHNWCFLAFSMLSHTTLVCSIAQLAAPALVCMQVTDFRPFPYLNGGSSYYRISAPIQTGKRKS